MPMPLVDGQSQMAAAEHAVYGDGPIVLGSGQGDADLVAATIDPALGADALRLALAEATWPRRCGARWSSSPMARRRPAARALRASRQVLVAANILRSGRPAYGWRGFHVDVARRGGTRPRPSPS